MLQHWLNEQCWEWEARDTAVCLFVFHHASLAPFLVNVRSSEWKMYRMIGAWQYAKLWSQKQSAATQDNLFCSRLATLALGNRLHKRGSTVNLSTNVHERENVQ